MKLKHLFLLSLIVIVLQSKKCNDNTPPPPHPAPTGSTKKTLTMPLDNGDNPSATSYPYPNTGPVSFPTQCVFTINDIASIRVIVKYKAVDNNNNIIDVVFSDKMYSNTDVYYPNGAFCPQMDIDVPDAGWYWVEIEYTFQDCSECCGKKITDTGTGIDGCDATPQTNNLEQGKPKIWGKTSFDDYTNVGTIGGSFSWDEYKFICICDCQ